MIEDQKVQKVWVHLAGLVQDPPELFRMEFLRSIGTLAGAEHGFVFLTAQPQQSPESVIEWKEPPVYRDFQETVSRFLLSGGEFQQYEIECEPFQQIELYRLGWQEKTLGTVVLLFGGNRAAAEMLFPFMRFYALYEHFHDVLHLLELSVKSFEAISRENAAIANELSHLMQQTLSNQKRLQSISKGILRTQEEERAKISRELHDEVGQALTALNINLDLLTGKLQNRISQEEMEWLLESKSIAGQSLQDVRELSRLLRPQMLDDLGLFPTLRSYVRSYSQRSGIVVNMDLEGNEGYLNPDVRTILFRITQEALTNVARHSGAKTADVRVHVTETGAEMKVTDDGAGFILETKPAKGSGLSGMRDRVSLFGGHFHIDTQPGRGTTLHVEIPFNGQD